MNLLPELGPVGRLVIVTLSCILQIVAVSGMGYIMARVGVLDRRMQSKLNKLNVSVLTPALLFGKIAFYLTPQRLTELAIVPAGFLCVSVISALAAALTSRLLRVLPGQRNFVMACSITPNSNTLPVALISSLVYSVPELHWVENGQDSDQPELMFGRALTYLVMFSTLGTVQRWSIAAKLLEGVKGISNFYYGSDHPSRSGFRDDVTDPLIDEHHRSQFADRNSILHHAPATSSPLRSELLADEAQEADTPSVPAPPSHGWAYAVTRPMIRFWHAFLNFMTVPLWAALLSFIIVLLPKVQNFVKSVDPFVDAVEQLGQCSVPMSILVLGSYFHDSDEDESNVTNHGSMMSAREDAPDAHEHAAEAAWEKRMTWRTIVAASASRMIVTPLLMLPLVAYVCLTNDTEVVGDPVFIACACLVIGSPPALTLAQISRQRGDPSSNLEALISGTIFVSYIFLTGPVTVLLVFFALYIDKMQALFL